MLKLFILLTISALTNLTKPFLTDTQQEIILSLEQHLHVKNGLIIKNSSFKISFDILLFVKRQSKFNVFSSFINEKEMLENMFNYGEWHYYNLKKYDQNITEKFSHPKSLAFIFGENTMDTLRLIFSAGKNEAVLWKYTWLMFDKDLNFSSLYIPYNCQFLTIENVRKDEIKITEIYDPRYSSQAKFKSHFGTWSDKNGLQVIENDFYRRRFDMNNTDLFIKVNCLPPNCHSQLIFYLEVIETIAKEMNFKLISIFPDIYEEKRKNPEFRCDFYLQPLLFGTNSFIRDRIGLFWELQLHLYIRHDEEYEQHGLSPYTRPLSSNLWLAIYSWILLSGFCFVLIYYFFGKKQKSKKLLYFSISNGFVQPFEALIGQGGDETVTTTSYRIATIVAQIVSIYIFQSYSGAILSFILSPSIKLPFTNIEGLVQDGRFKIGYYTNIGTVFQSSNDASMKKIYEKFLFDPIEMPKNYTDAIDKTCQNSKFALFIHSLDPKYLKCELLKIPTPVDIMYHCLGATAFSPYTKIFNRMFLKNFRSSGYMKRVEKIIFAYQIKLDKALSFKESEVVYIENIIPLIRVIGYLYILSVIILSLEWFYNRRKSNF